MPFELGIFMGFKHSTDAKQQAKKILILDKERYRYQQFISDIAGQDIRSHDGMCEKLIREVRHWLQNQQKARSLPGADRLTQRFAKFQVQIPSILARLHKAESDLKNYHDFHSLVSDWIDQEG